MTDPGNDGSASPVRGVGVDARGRCTHWGSPVDIVSFRFPCCDGWWACHECHEEVADHPAERWPRSESDTVAVRCGACDAELAIAEYLASPESCPRCAAAFNPRCALHHPLYFEA